MAPQRKQNMSSDVELNLALAVVASSTAPLAIAQNRQSCFVPSRCVEWNSTSRPLRKPEQKLEQRAASN